MKQQSDLERSLVVAVVDDDAAVCNSLKFALELEGFVVRSYDGAAEALQAGKLDNCDCFVIDQRMPNLPGIELIMKLRSQKNVTPAILLVSNPAGATLCAQAAKNGIPIVEKPLLDNALVETIRQLCQHD